MAKTSNSAVDYHWAHAHIRHRISPHSLDFNNYPQPFKAYSDPCKISLDTKSGKGVLSPEGSLADLLFFAYGVTYTRQAGKIPFFYRTVPSAGGLYPCHLYLVIESVEKRKFGNCETGVYYYDPVHTCLVQLRTGKHPIAVRACEAGQYRAQFIITASFYNSAWKYRGRAYRYMLLDAGHLVRTLELVLGAQGISCRVDYDFSDRDIAGFLNLDMAAEVPLVCVTVGWDKSVSEILERITKTTRPDFPDSVARPEEKQYMKGYGVLPGIHAAGIPVQQPEDFKETKITGCLSVATLDITSETKSGKIRENRGKILEPLLIGRRSRRNFVSSSVSREAFLVLLEWLRAGLAADNVKAYRFLQTGMVCRNLEGLEDGFYLFDRGFSRVHLMNKGQLAKALASVCLDQTWISRAAITFLFFTDLKALETAFGPRGYRSLMMTAGRLGQQIYLGAEALGLGCCGIGAIYDEEAGQLFDLNRDSALVYAVAAGPVKKRTGP